MNQARRNRQSFGRKFADHKLVCYSKGTSTPAPVQSIVSRQKDGWAAPSYTTIRCQPARRPIKNNEPSRARVTVRAKRRTITQARTLEDAIEKAVPTFKRFKDRPYRTKKRISSGNCVSDPVWTVELCLIQGGHLGDPQWLLSGWSLRRPPSRLSVHTGPNQARTTQEYPLPSLCLSDPLPIATLRPTATHMKCPLQQERSRPRQLLKQ